MLTQLTTSMQIWLALVTWLKGYLWNAISGWLAPIVCLLRLQEMQYGRWTTMVIGYREGSENMDAGIKGWWYDKGYTKHHWTLKEANKIHWWKIEWIILIIYRSLGVHSVSLISWWKYIIYFTPYTLHHQTWLFGQKLRFSSFSFRGKILSRFKKV